MPTTPAPTTSISPAAAVMLAVSVLAGTTLAGMVAAQAIVPTVHMYLGAGPLLGSVATLFGGGFLANLAVAKVMRRLDQLEARMDEHAANLTEQGEDQFASAFVAAAAGGRPLRAVPRQG